MEFGSIDVFYAGLEGLIGRPEMVDGSLKVSMRLEYCSRKDSSAPFGTSNGMAGVTSEKEWEMVTDPQPGETYPERGGRFKEEHPEWCRKNLPLDHFVVKMGEVNKKLECNGHTQMITCSRCCTMWAR